LYSKPNVIIHTTQQRVIKSFENIPKIVLRVCGLPASLQVTRAESRKYSKSNTHLMGGLLSVGG